MKTRWLYHMEAAPDWDESYQSNNLFAVHIPRRYPPEIGASAEEQVNLYPYEIVCLTLEEAKWVLQELETFFKRFDTLPKNDTPSTAIP